MTIVLLQRGRRGVAPAVCSDAAIVPAKFSARNFLDDVRRYGATYMNYVAAPPA